MPVLSTRHVGRVTDAHREQNRSLGPLGALAPGESSRLSVLRQALPPERRSDQPEITQPAGGRGPVPTPKAMFFHLGSAHTWESPRVL